MQYNNHSVNIFYKKREKINLIRPLLFLNRFQALKICVFFCLPIYIDPTNKLVSFRRNRLRYQIIPTFKAFFNPKINIALNRVISIVNCETAYFTNHLKNIEKFFKIKKYSLKNFKKIQNQKWLAFLPKALQKRAYKKLLASRFKSLSFSEIEFLLQINVLFFK